MSTPKPTFNSRNEALALPHPERGQPFIEYPALGLPQFKLRVHPPDATGRVKRHYAVRIKYKGPDKNGVVKQLEDRTTLGLVEAVEPHEQEMPFKEARAEAQRLIRRAEEIRQSPAALKAAVQESKRPTVAKAWALREATFRTMRAATVEKERGNYARYLRPFADRYLDELNKQHWDEFITALGDGKHPDPRDGCKQIKGRPLREATLRGIITSAASLYTAAHLGGLLPDKPNTWNPPAAAKKTTLKSPAKRKSHVPLKDIAKTWRAADPLCAPWARDQLRLYMLTGLRHGLMSSLRFDEVDFASGCLYIDPNRAGTKRRAKDTAEDAPHLRLPLCNTALGILKARQEFAPDPAGAVWFAVVPTSGGGKATHQDPRTNWANIYNRVLGGRAFTPHDLRRTFATAAVEADAPLVGASLMMLHSPRTVASVMGLPDITFDYINTEEAQGVMRKAAEAVERYVLGLLDGSITPKETEPQLPPRLRAAFDTETDE